MDTLKKLFPFSFGAKDVAGLIIKTVVYIAADIVLGFLISLLAKIPFIGIIFSIAASLVGLYCLVGIVITFLDYFKILK